MSVILAGTVEPIRVYAVDGNSVPLTGLADLYVRIERESDGFFFDWNDLTFKGSGWTTLNKLLAELDATNLAGLYEVAGGFDTGTITNPAADDRYTVYALQTPGTSARLPAPVSFDVGLWVDQIDDILTDTAAMQPLIDVAVSTREAESDAAARAATNQGEHDATQADIAALNNLSAAEAADAVWDELLTGHTLADSAGKALSDIEGTVGTPADTAAAVWDALRSSHTVVGSFGETTRLTSAGLSLDAADEIRDRILSDGVAFPGANIDALISSRAVAGDAMDLIAGAVDANALDASAAAEISDHVWDETATDHVGANSMGQLQNRLDAAITTRAVPGDAMDLVANAVDATSLAADAVAEIADGVWNELLSGHTAVGSAGEALARVDVDVSTRAAPGANMGLTTGAIDGVADQVWDELLAGHTAVGSAGEAQAYLDVAVSSRAAPGDAMDLVADAVDATSLADAGRDKIVDQVWRETLADHSGVVGSTAEALDNVSAPAAPAVVAAAVWDRLLSLHVIPGSAGVVLAGRAAPGDAMDLVADAVDSSALATSAVNEIRDAILSDSTPFAGANMDAAVSSRAVPGDAMAMTAPAETQLVDAIWDENIQTAHGTSYSAGLALRVLGVDISQRTNNPSLNSILGVPDVVGQDLPLVIDTKLSSSHGSGNWEGVDWSPTEKQQIRGALGIVGTQASPVGGGELQDILADTAAIDARLPTDPADESLQQASHAATQAAIAGLTDLDQAGVQAAMTAQGYNPGRAVALDNLDAAMSSRSSHTAADVDTQLSGTHGAGSWETGGFTPTEKEQLRDALGIDGTKTTAVDGQLQDLIARVG